MYSFLIYNLQMSQNNFIVHSSRSWEIHVISDLVDKPNSQAQSP